MSKNLTLREIVDKIVILESSLSPSLFLATEYPNNKKYIEDYQKDSLELNSLYQKINKIQEDYSINFLSDLD